MSINGKLNYYINGISGIWNSYGCIPEEGEALSLYVEDSSLSDDSLIDLCGFDTERKNLGVLENGKTIEELVILLPMMQEQIDFIEAPPGTASYIPPPDRCAPCEEIIDPCEDNLTPNKQKNKKIKFKGLTYCKTEDAWLFTINPKLINSILGVKDYKKIKIGDVQGLLEKNITLNNDNNIVKLIRCMVKYNIPPHLNWLAFPKQVPPYAFYVAEFSSELSKKDLGDIWQGTMPGIAQVPEEEEVVIEHYLTNEEIFGGYNISEYEDMKLKIFKCKKRASNNYNNFIIKQNSYKSNMGVDTSLNRWYHYNWPYDNFSLVELLKVEAGEVHDYKYDGNSTNGVVTRTYQNSDGSQTSYQYSSPQASFNAELFKKDSENKQKSNAQKQWEYFQNKDKSTNALKQWEYFNSKDKLNTDQELQKPSGIFIKDE